jgi:hypothetical protein
MTLKSLTMTKIFLSGHPLLNPAIINRTMLYLEIKFALVCGRHVNDHRIAQVYCDIWYFLASFLARMKVSDSFQAMDARPMLLRGNEYLCPSVNNLDDPGSLLT